VSTYDVKLEALDEINRARTYIGCVRMRLREMHKKLKRAGIRVEMLDFAMDDAAAADKHACAARLALNMALADERKAAKCE